ncbi:DUF4422 domain-containing protein [Clostridiaceae bacterium]|nr:DUF4422 domain-containing protein [Clostridiaceae bacterium]
MVGKYYAEDKMKTIMKEKEIVIFGARFMALGVAACLMGKPYERDIKCFVVGRVEENPSEFLGKPVISIAEARNQLSPHQWIVIASMERNLEFIMESLHQSGFYNLLPLTFESDLWSDIRGNYFMEYCQENRKEYWKLEEVLERQIKEPEMRDGDKELGGGTEGETKKAEPRDKDKELEKEIGKQTKESESIGREKKLEEKTEKQTKEPEPIGKEKELGEGTKGQRKKQDSNGRNEKLEEETGQPTDGNSNLTGDNRNQGVCIYTAKCHVDRELKEDLHRYSWEIPIQVGATLTGERICEVRDNTGDHISEKNREYCELTALYWIWKNTSSQYAGLCHYRRHFELNEDLLDQLCKSEVDVAVTVPILNFPSVKEVYRQDHVKQDWEIMMEAIGILQPKYQKAAEEVEKGIYYYGYNMFFARKEIVDDYCSWLFPILAYCERHCEKKEDPYQNRYIGFLAERLLTIYLKGHEGKYTVVHVRKHFVER